MKSKNIEINPEYESLFSFDNHNDKIEHDAQMISYRILNEIEEICEQRNLKKKDLALKIGTSKSYITQLFRGTKSVNTQIMARFEDALDISFEIKARSQNFVEDTIDEYLNAHVIIKNRHSNENGRWYFCPDLKEKGYPEEEEKILSALETEHLQTQAAA